VNEQSPPVLEWLKPSGSFSTGVSQKLNAPCEARLCWPSPVPLTILCEVSSSFTNVTVVPGSIEILSGKKYLARISEFLVD